MASHQIFTIGHSTHSLDSFLALLRAHEVSTVVDVRSSPYSRFNPVFNREPLKQELKAQGMYYVFLGKELGGRPSDPACYESGRANYVKMAATDLFRTGLQRVVEGSVSQGIVLMCSEADPLECHRTLLVTRAMAERGIAVAHIHRQGTVETQAEAEERLLRAVGLSGNLLRSRDEALAEAYVLQARRVAYVEQPATSIAAKVK